MERLDIAIVGAGMAGLYCGYRLTGTTAKRVALFEASPRAGGRLHSVTPEGMPHLRAEVGGMRYYTFQAFVNNLIEHLGLESKPFHEGNEKNLFFLRGKRLRVNEVEDLRHLPYNLSEEEQQLPLSHLLLNMLLKVVPNGRSLTPEQLSQVRREGTFHGNKLYDLGLQSILLELGCTEAVNLLSDIYGHDAMVGNWNAAELITLVLGHLGGQGEKRTLVDGMQALPLALARAFVAQGGSLEHGQTLRRLDRHESGVKLTFADGREVVAAQVILAMPRRSLELLDQNCVLFHGEQFRRDLLSVVPLRATKLFVSYREPWWRQLGIIDGRTDTDLPLRQCFYFGVEGEQPGADPNNQNSLVMAGYNDSGSADYWSSFVWPDRDFEQDLSAPPSMVEDVQRQLRQVHGIPISEPYDAMFMDWSSEPYGGGWHSWRVHARAWEVGPRMRHPYPDLPVHICGEAWSTEQGWIQGALNTAELVLEQHFGVERPSFLPASHALE